jgi:hypothetical protein
MNSEQLLSQLFKSCQYPDLLFKVNQREVDQIIKALENWKQECVHLEEGISEGFGEETDNEVQKVSKALIRAKEMRDSH